MLPSPRSANAISATHTALIKRIEDTPNAIATARTAIMNSIKNKICISGNVCIIFLILFIILYHTLLRLSN